MSTQPHPPRRSPQIKSRFAKALAGRIESEDFFIAEGSMDSNRLNKLFAPAMVEANAVRNGSGWVLRGELVCTTLWLQRGWMMNWHTNIGAYRTEDAHCASSDCPWSYRLYDGIKDLHGSSADLLDFERELIFREARVQQIREFSVRVAAELHRLQDITCLHELADQDDHGALPEFRQWLSVQVGAGTGDD